MFERKLAVCGYLFLESRQIAKKSYCHEPYDCSECDVFAWHVDSLIKEKGGSLQWACFRCLGPGRDRGVAKGTLLGYYNEGLCDWCSETGIALNAVWISD